MMKPAIIFDMDGTLFETDPVALQGFKRTFERLIEQGYYQGDMPSDEMFLDQLGKTFHEIWDSLIPDSNEHVRELADRWMLEIELELIRSGVGKLYPNVKEVLTELKSLGYSLFVASNGLEAYIAAIVDYYELNDLFTDLYSAGRFQTESKVDLVRLLMDTYHIESGFMVGDRHSDVEAGKENGLTVIGCKFGFADESELSQADIHITSFQELISFIDSVSSTERT